MTCQPSKLNLKDIPDLEGQVVITGVSEFPFWGRPPEVSCAHTPRCLRCSFVHMTANLLSPMHVHIDNVRWGWSHHYRAFGSSVPLALSLSAPPQSVRWPSAFGVICGVCSWPHSWRVAGQASRPSGSLLLFLLLPQNALWSTPNSHILLDLKCLQKVDLFDIVFSGSEIKVSETTSYRSTDVKRCTFVKCATKKEKRLILNWSDAQPLIILMHVTEIIHDMFKC